MIISFGNSLRSSTVRNRNNFSNEFKYTFRCKWCNLLISKKSKFISSLFASMLCLVLIALHMDHFDYYIDSFLLDSTVHHNLVYLRQFRICFIPIHSSNLIPTKVSNRSRSVLAFLHNAVCAQCHGVFFPKFLCGTS